MHFPLIELFIVDIESERNTVKDCRCGAAVGKRGKNILKKMLRKVRQEDGVMAIEACISVTIFILLMVSTYCFETLFMAQSAIGHAMKETVESMAVEAYRIGKFHDEKFSTDDIHRGLIELIAGAGSKVSQGVSDDFQNDSNYATNENWFFTDDDRKIKTEESKAAFNRNIQTIAKERFATYFAGGVQQADKMLKAYGVKGGLNGIDFSETGLEGSDLTLKISYKIRILIPFELFDTFNISQSVCAKIWK